MKLLMGGVNYYWEDYYPEIYGTYAVQYWKGMKISRIPSIKKAQKLWDKHVSHKDAESSLLENFIVTNDDKTVVYAYYDGRRIYRFNELSAEKCNELISQKDKVKELYLQSSFESGWDNFETGRRMYAQADKLKNMIALARTALAFNYSVNCAA